MVSAGGLGFREEIDIDAADSACAELDVAGPCARIEAAFALALKGRVPRRMRTPVRIPVK